MRLLVRHGLNGEKEQAIDVGDQVPAGWDIMVQLAHGLNLVTISNYPLFK